ncbi:helix-turn-helix domain-containing protein [Mariniblastus fucicola]|uniref:Transcriptional regulatory protein ZraR n=1 Tax=Mariniblastus fucicola TaxID=980251 RepID=A0A5B9PDD5_9BACT|nr:helix-turn-helix domain-containing protein [Mariniblastus fucicola]QEG24707.1 Transcriptional regulatory protein ZraR [Mariniblastus fucicola]
MAKTRKINNALLRIFDQSSSIVYLISDVLKLSYANEACAAWVGMELEFIVGTNLVYTSEPLEGKAEDAVKGLSIAPNLITAPDVVDSFSIQIFSNASSQLKVRSACVNAIYDHRGVLSGYLVVGSAEDADVPDANVRESIDLPAKLHNALVLVRQRHQKRFNLKRLVGTSAASDRVRRQLQSAADSDGDVLIVGPTGSGREHVARTVFAGSVADEIQNHDGGGDHAESESRLVPLHCSITDPSLVQSTMKELLIQKSTKATLLLIDVDLLDAGSQQELLGYLQLPGLSARMIATSSTRLIDSGTNFDPLLASRLSTLTIELPSLADRREDLPLLAQAILESRNDQQAKQFSGFTRQAIEMICEYDWPENFGQLSSAIEEATANASGSIIQVADFSETFQHTIKAQRFAAKEETKIQLDQYLQEIEEQLVDRAVAQAKGNKTKAAELLGISRAKLLRRLAMFEKDTSGEDELLDPSVFKEEPDEG